jgi:hypothetical protein
VWIRHELILGGCRGRKDLLHVVHRRFECFGVGDLFGFPSWVCGGVLGENLELTCSCRQWHTCVVFIHGHYHGAPSTPLWGFGLSERNP